jgi:hypothetical protein
VRAQALIIDEPWIGHIMAGRKTWEMRSRRTTKRGPVGLVRKGSGQIVAVANIVDSLPPLSPTQMAASFDEHRIPQAMVETASYKWFTPWVLGNVRVLEQPVSYRHPSGAVTWVDLAPDVQAALAAAKTRPASTVRPQPQDGKLNRCNRPVLVPLPDRHVRPRGQPHVASASKRMI